MAANIKTPAAYNSLCGIGENRKTTQTGVRIILNRVKEFDKVIIITQLYFFPRQMYKIND
jgi:hypothetical protein